MSRHKLFCQNRPRSNNKIAGPSKYAIPYNLWEASHGHSNKIKEANSSTATVTQITIEGPINFRTLPWGFLVIRPKNLRGEGEPFLMKTFPHP